MAELLALAALMLPLKPDDTFGRIRRALDDRDRSLADSVDALQPDALTEYVDHPTVDVRISGQDSERGTFNQVPIPQPPNTKPENGQERA